MAWNDDSWKDGYDAWKLRSPYDDEPEEEPEDDCTHDDYEADILTGIATCCRCGHRWMQTREEIAAEHVRIVAYDEMMRKDEFRERWLWWWRGLRDGVRRPFSWRKRSAPIDDDIPF